ncbi:D-alanyl-D-alanine carboxypeptidase [Paracraurococcus ruber]|uniref:Peptidase S11 D-alanyl-D-alanine carboxypeptidase A N-terminal domain-containing protein n=2 Tax=Paracraurococcus ruber TaxID=77675 RepID=A0ABS1D5P5_9PROT|nr:hypothetical protein [Paracraurococcus ruber]TDG32039.1 D-alanyl-D-alanine carboxypeptidase [Paracraurococcus ruber]
MSGTSASLRGRVVGALMLAFGIGLATPAAAQIGSERYAAIVVDARTGNTLIAASPDERRYPASLTKMMTVYMAFEALRDGRIELNAPIRVSYEAAAMPPSKLGLVPGMSITVEEAILALVTKSANDAAAALGEYMGGGSEDRFAQMMTLRARSLGMRNTTFRNASGLPDLDQVSTARDMALLGQRLIKDFPERYAYFSTPHFVFRGRTHWNHNRLLQEYDGADGIKTGYVNDSGFNLVASAQRDGVRLIAAVFGGRTGRERDRHMMALLDQGFASMGVSPARDAPMARRGLPSIMASAQAAPVARATARPARAVAVVARAAPQPRAARRTVEARTAPLRATTVKQARAALRVEQGDTGRAAAAPAKRPAVVATKPLAKPMVQPAAAKLPAKTNGRRSG